MQLNGITLLIGIAREDDVAWMAPLGTEPPSQYPPPYSSGWNTAAEVIRIMLDEFRS
jgi:hypothetical protein